ncbi:MAG TPA: alpha/beta hydrolase [Allocoleopsis sp.]
MFLLLRLSLVLAGMLGIVYLAALLFLYLRQTRLIFLPSAQIEATPAEVGLVYQEVSLPVRHDFTQKLHGWWIPATGQEVGVLLYLHGNGLNISANVAHAHRFHKLGLSVLLMDYRGYGKSVGGFPTEAKVYEDAQLMWNYLTQTRKIPADRIFIYGHSLGGAIAIDLAVHHPNAPGVIVDGSFTSMADMARLNPLFSRFPINFVLTQRFNSIRKVRALQMPVLFIHGTADDRVPSFMSQALYVAAPEPKFLYLVPQAGHNDVAEVAGDEYLQTTQQFIRQAIASQVSPRP